MISSCTRDIADANHYDNAALSDCTHHRPPPVPGAVQHLSKCLFDPDRRHHALGTFTAVCFVVWLKLGFLYVECASITWKGVGNLRYGSDWYNHEAHDAFATSSHHDQVCYCTFAFRKKCAWTTVVLSVTVIVTVTTGQHLLSKSRTTQLSHSSLNGVTQVSPQTLISLTQV